MNKILIILALAGVISAVSYMPHKPRYSLNYQDLSFLHSSQGKAEKKEKIGTMFLDEGIPVEDCTTYIQNLVTDNQEVEDAFMELVSGTDKFVDATFDGDTALDADSSKYAWETAETILAYDGATVQLFDGDLFSIDDDDISQGSLGNCYLLAAIAALTEYPDEIRDFFVNDQENANGAYAMRLVIGGVPRLITLDDYFPSNGRGFAYNHMQDSNPDIWVQLIEKAWAKISGNYQNTEAGNTNDPLHALTGAPSWGWYHDETGTWENGLDKDDLLVNLKFGQERDYLFGAGAPGTEDCGIVPYHAYTVIDIFSDVTASDGNQYDLFFIKNPWGTNENYPWEGDFSETSDLWDSVSKATVGYDEAMGNCDGCFYMHYDDYYQCFGISSISAQDPSYIYNFVEFYNTGLGAVTFTKNVDEIWYVSIESIFDRIYQKSEGCSAINANGDLEVTVYCDDTIVGSSSVQFEYATTAIIEGATGNCMIKAKSELEDFYPKFTLSIYSSEIIHMTEATLTCTDYVPDVEAEWHLDLSSNYNCPLFESRQDPGDCSGYDSFTGEGLTASQACEYCGGGICTSVDTNGGMKTGHYEYSKPTWFSEDQESAETGETEVETPEVEVDDEIQCDSQCDTCVTTADNCIECAFSRNAPPECPCEPGTYEDDVGNCVACSYQCNTCEDEATNCLECDSVRTGAPNCDCPEGYYENNENGDIYCEECPIECETCDSSSNCLTCAGNRISQPDCDCPEGYEEVANEADCAEVVVEEATSSRRLFLKMNLKGNSHANKKE